MHAFCAWCSRARQNNLVRKGRKRREEFGEDDESSYVHGCVLCNITNNKNYHNTRNTIFLTQSKFGNVASIERFHCFNPPITSTI